MPNGVAPLGRAVGDELISFRCPPRTVKPLTYACPSRRPRACGRWVRAGRRAGRGLGLVERGAAEQLSEPFGQIR